MLVVAGLGRGAAAEPLNSTAFGSTDLSAYDDAVIYAGLLEPAERMVELEERERLPRPARSHACASGDIISSPPEAPPRWPALLAILVALVVARASTRVGELQ